MAVKWWLLFGIAIAACPHTDICIKVYRINRYPVIVFNIHQQLFCWRLTGVAARGLLQKTKQYTSYSNNNIPSIVIWKNSNCLDVKKTINNDTWADKTYSFLE